MTITQHNQTEHNTSVGVAGIIILSEDNYILYNFVEGRIDDVLNVGVENVGLK